MRARSVVGVWPAGGGLGWIIGALATALLAYPSAIHGQATELRFEALAVDLPQNVVTWFLQDSTGFAWLATQGGLARFDGHSTVVYTSSRTSRTRLPSAVVRTVAEAPGGRIWVGTVNGIGLLDPRDESIRVFGRNSEGDEAWGRTDVLLPEGDGVWVGSEGGGLVRLHPDSGVTQHFTNDPNDPASIPDNRVMSLARTPGHLWAGTPNGAAALDLNTGQWQRFRLGPDGDPNAVPRIVPASDGRLWMGTRRGVVRLDPGTGVIERIDVGHPLIQDIEIADDGRLWVSTYGGGLRRYDPETGTTEEFTTRNGTTGLPDDRLTDILRDRTGLLWIGTWGGGAVVTDPSADGFDLLGPDEGLASTDVTVIEPIGGDSLLIGSFEGGVDLLVPGAERLEALAAAARIPARDILAIHRSEDGTLWLGSLRSGLYEIGVNGAIRQRDLELDDPQGLASSTVYAIEEAPTGTLWIGTPSGVRRLDRATDRFSIPSAPEAEVLGRAYVRSIEIDSRGLLWLGTFGHGVWVGSPEQDRWRRIVPPDSIPLPEEVSALRVEGETTWVGSRGEGEVFRIELGAEPFDAAAGIEAVARLAGAAEVGCMLPDADGDLWIGAEPGLMRMREGEGVMVGRADGLPTAQIRPGCARRSDGTLVLASREGVVTIRPSAVAPGGEPAPTVVSRVTLRGEPLAGDAPPYLGTELTVSAGPDPIRLSLGLLDFRTPSLHRFEYRMSEDGPWTSVGQSAEVTFAGLPPGRYLFVARGRDAHGTPGIPSAPLVLDVTPRFYQTVWFRGLVFLALLGTVAGISMNRVRSVERHNARLRAEIDERLRVEAARQALEEQLRQSQKLEAVGRLTGGVAHDFNNALTVILGNAELLLEEQEETGGDPVLVDEMLRAATQAADLTQRLLAFSRKQVLAPVRTDLVALVEGLIPLLNRTLGGVIDINFAHGADAAVCEIDRPQAEAALVNLSINARDAMGGRGRLHLRVDRVSADGAEDGVVPAGEWVTLSVRDEGEGITPESLEHIFEPFFTTKAPGEGTGLGLSMVYGFVTQSNGHVRVESAVGVGTTFILYFPVAPDEGARAAS